MLLSLNSMHLQILMGYHLTILLYLAASPVATVLNHAKMIAPRQMNSVVLVQQRVNAIVGMTMVIYQQPGLLNLLGKLIVSLELDPFFHQLVVLILLLATNTTPINLAVYKELQWQLLSLFFGEQVRRMERDFSRSSI